MSEQNFSKAEAMLAHLRARGITISVNGGQFRLQAKSGDVGENDISALRAMLQALGLVIETPFLQGMQLSAAAVQSIQALTGDAIALPALVDEHSPDKGATLSLPLVARDVEVLRHKSGAWFSSPLGVGATLFAVLLSRYQQKEDWLREIGVAIGQQRGPGEPPQAWFCMPPLIKRLPTEGSLRDAVSAVADGLLEASVKGEEPLDLALALPDAHDEDQLLWYFASDLFDEEFIRQLHADFVAIMRQATALITPLLSALTLYGNPSGRSGVSSPNTPAAVSLPAPIEQETRENSALWRSVQAVIDGHAARAQTPPVTAATQDRTYWPLSPQQWQFVLDEQKNGAGSRHNVTSAWLMSAHNLSADDNAAPRNSGVIDLDKAQKALSALVKRHDILRTTFEWQSTPDAVLALQHVSNPAGCSQCVHTQLPLPWRAMVVSTSGDFQIAARQWLDDAAAQALSLFAGQPWQASVATVSNGSETASIWRLTLHNAIADRHAADLLMTEWQALYAGETLPALAEQYSGFSLRQQKALAPCLQLDRHSNDWAFWSEQLQSIKPLQWPLLTDPQTATEDVSSHSFSIDAELMQRVTVAAAAWQVSMESILLTAFESVIRRYVAQDCFVVGVEFVNRQTDAQRQVCGVVANVLPQVAQLDDHRQAVRHRVEQTHNQLADMAHYQHTPLVALLPLLAANRTRGSQPPVVVGFSCEVEPLDAAQPLLARGLEKLHAARRQHRYGLALNVRCSHEHLSTGELEFAGDMLCQAGAADFAHQFLHLLAGMVADAVAPLAQLPLMSLSQQQDIFDLFNREAQCLPAFLPHFLMWLQRQCYSAAHSPAVVAAEGRMSFAELDSLANQIARYLVTQDIGAGERIGLLLPRDPIMLASVLALFKVGAAYVPVHAHWPQDYQEAVLQQAGVSCVLHDSERNPWQGALPALDFSITASPWQALDADAFDDADDSSALACIVYPPQVTATPVGVAVTHRNLSALVAWGVRMNENRPSIRCAFTRDLCAATALYEIFVTLGSGGAVVIIDDLMSPVARERPTSAAAKLLGVVNQLTLTPSYASEMLASNAFPQGIRTVCLAGEAASAPLLNALLAVPGVDDLIVLHSCAENGGVAFVALYGKHAKPATTEVAIAASRNLGLPVDGTQCVVLGPQGQLQPWGIAGDLYIGGAALSSGYWQNNEMTAQHFVRNPLAYFPALGNTVFRTGYRACWHANGQLELLSGASDLAEFAGGFERLRAEMQICNTLGIVSCAVNSVLNPVTHQPTRMAFIRGDLPARHYLQLLTRQLPKELCPEGVTVVAGHWLRTAQELLDRAALNAHYVDGKSPAADAAPNTLELQILRLWQELLGDAVQNIDTDFIAAGGHSLLALQLATQLAQRYALQTVPSFAVLMQHPTPRRLARWLDAAMRGEESRATLWEALVERTADRSVLCFRTDRDVIPWAQVAAVLPERMAGFAVHYQPRANEDLVLLAQRYVDAMEQESLPLPAALVGAGAGGVLAAVVAREMHLRGWPWLPVIMLDSAKQAMLAPIRSRVLHVSSPRSGLQIRQGWTTVLHGEVMWRTDSAVFEGEDGLVGGRVARWISAVLDVA